MQLGPWWVDIYTARLVGACTLAALWLGMSAPQQGIATPEFLIGIWTLALIGVVAGRAGYVWIHRDYFAQHPSDVVTLGSVGGLNGATAWGGGLLVAALWSRRRGRNLKRLMSWLAPAFLLVAAGAWWGCMHTGCAWGREIRRPSPWLQWMVAESPDLMRSIRPRYTVRAVGLIAALLTAGGALALGKDGAYALVLYLIVEIGLTLLRGNPVPTIGSVRIDTLALALWAALILRLAVTSPLQSQTEPLDTHIDTPNTLD
jgi:hypothetical protein